MERQVDYRSWSDVRDDSMSTRFIDAYAKYSNSYVCLPGMFCYVSLFFKLLAFYKIIDKG